MKYLFSFLIITLSGCSTFSQKVIGRLSIDTTLHNPFFDVPEYITESIDSLFTDSIIVGVNNYTDTTDNRGRSNIRESNRLHYSFYNCRSYFLGDTLLVQFYNKSKILLDTIVVKIIGNSFFSYFNFADGNEIYATEPQQLTFKKMVERKNQIIFGELKIKALDLYKQKEFTFSGPFICTVE